MADLDWRIPVYARDGGATAGVRRGPRPAAKRRALRLQGGRCLYCQLPIGTRVRRHSQPVALVANWDHFVPFAYLAQNPDANWVLSCQVCNGIKSSRIFQTVEAARAVILPRRIVKGYETPAETLARVKPRRKRRVAVAAKTKTPPKTRAGVPAPRKPIERALPKGAVSHGCGAWWTGNRRAHCPSCCQTFANERIAALHRVDTDDGRQCQDPQQVGLVRVSHPWGTCWEKPKPSEPA
jgi:hypothetical protein